MRGCIFTGQSCSSEPHECRAKSTCTCTSYCTVRTCMYPVALKQANRYTKKFVYALQVPDANTRLMDKFFQVVAKGSFIQFLFFVCVFLPLASLFAFRPLLRRYQNGRKSGAKFISLLSTKCTKVGFAHIELASPRQNLELENKV